MAGKKAEAKTAETAETVEVEKKGPGRPSLYSEELADRICELIADEKSVEDIGSMEGMPCSKTIWRWMDSNDDFVQRCARASKIRAARLVEGMVGIEKQTIAGVIDPAVARVVLSNQQWRASKLDSKRFGDKQQIEHSGEVKQTREPGVIASELKELAADPEIKALLADLAKP